MAAAGAVRYPRLQLGAAACACWLELVPLTEVSDNAGRTGAGRDSSVNQGVEEQAAAAVAADAGDAGGQP